MSLLLHLKVLQDLHLLLKKLPQNYLPKPIEVLSNASIGQHFRHIIEFYQCACKGQHLGVVNYDLRVRDKRLEEDVNCCLDALTNLTTELQELFKTKEKTIILESFLDAEATEKIRVKSTLQRELTYCFDHCIHHQAIIKIALKEMQLSHITDDNFGVAVSTIHHKKKCAL